MKEQRPGPPLAPHHEIHRAVDALLAAQAVKAVRVERASGPAHARDARVIPIKAWERIRRLASSRGVVVMEPFILGREEAARLGAVLRAGQGEAEAWPPKAKNALQQVLNVLALGEGIQVSQVQ